MNFIGQILGFLAILTAYFIYRRKDRNSVLKLKLLADVLWASHNFLIGAFSGAVITGIAIGREVLFLKDKRRKIYLVLFPALYFLSLLLTYRGPLSVLPAIASTIATVGFWQQKPAAIRLLAAASSCLMLGYGLYVQSYATVANEVITLISIALFFIKSTAEKKS